MQHVPAKMLGPGTGASGLECTGGFLQTVAVGFGLDYRHDLLARELAGNGEIVKQGAQVDFGPSAWW